MRISVVTASLPTRAGMLAECLTSVAAQTLRPVEHLVGVDHARVGPAQVRTQLLNAAAGDWLAIVDDDDLLYPDHLATLAAGADESGADVVYTYCEVEGRDWSPNRGFDPDVLRYSNYIPITTLIRTDLARLLGGWRGDAANGWEDWDFWLRAMDAGARFACVPRVTWRYRFHGGNRTTRGDGAA